MHLVLLSCEAASQSLLNFNIVAFTLLNWWIALAWLCRETASLSRLACCPTSIWHCFDIVWFLVVFWSYLTLHVYLAFVCSVLGFGRNKSILFGWLVEIGISHARFPRGPAVFNGSLWICLSKVTRWRISYTSLPIITEWLSVRKSFAELGACCYGTSCPCCCCVLI